MKFKDIYKSKLKLHLNVYAFIDNKITLLKYVQGGLFIYKEPYNKNRGLYNNWFLRKGYNKRHNKRRYR
jgi:hypothetical protein